MISDSFRVFMKEAPKEQASWAKMIGDLSSASALDDKTQALCYITALVSADLLSGINYHVKIAKATGASRNEVKSAVLTALPVVGNRAIHALPVALDAYDEETAPAP